jgi:aspartyl protease family protein
LRTFACGAGGGRDPGDDMLRFAIFTAVGAAFLAYIAPDLVSLVVPKQGSQTTASVAIRPAAASTTPVNVAVATPSSGAAEASISADPRGQYSTDVEIDGQTVRMLVDTGATMVVLSYETAARLGLQVLASDFTARVQTANGVAFVAPITLREVTIGPIYVGDVKALVADRNAGPINLLGESFLKRLGSVEQRSGQLVLRQ